MGCGVTVRRARGRHAQWRKDGQKPRLLLPRKRITRKKLSAARDYQWVHWSRLPIRTALPRTAAPVVLFFSPTVAEQTSIWRQGCPARRFLRLRKSAVLPRKAA